LRITTVTTGAGDFAHWSQELTQFSISGGGYDIKVNGVVIDSPTQAVADLSILTNSGNAGLGTRTITMSTVGENLSLQSALLITGGADHAVFAASACRRPIDCTCPPLGSNGCKRASARSCRSIHAKVNRLSYRRSVRWQYRQDRQ
jgi:hypothetical protein